MIRAFAHGLYILVCWFILAPFLTMCALAARCYRMSLNLLNKRGKPRLLWAGAPMPSLASSSRALTGAGYDSICVANQRTTNNIAGQFDVMLAGVDRLVTGLNTPQYIVRAVLIFGRSMFSRDIYHTFFTGGILGNSPLRPLELFFWRLSGGKHVVFAYGQDGFVYSELPHAPWAIALKETYPRTISQDKNFKRRIDKTSKTADCVVGCIVHNVTLPRVDVWPVLWYPPGKFESNISTPRKTMEQNVFVAHPSNHRKIKGSDQLVSAIRSLQEEGMNISLDVIENVNITESRERIRDADIVVDQLLMGYAMTAIEALAAGKVVISGFDNSDMYAPFYTRSYLDECPIIPASPDTIKSVLENLIDDREKIVRLSEEGKIYFEKHHSDEACVSLFNSIYDKIWYGKSVDLENLFKPD